MSAKLIGRVKAGKSLKSYEVKWNPHNRHVYVGYAGWSKAGTATSASQAMNVAEAWLYDK